MKIYIYEDILPHWDRVFIAQHLLLHFTVLHRVVLWRHHGSANGSEKPFNVGHLKKERNTIGSDPATFSSCYLANTAC